MAVEALMGFPDLMDLTQTDKEAALSLFEREYESIAFVLSTSTSSGHDESYCIDLMNNRIEIKTFGYFKKFIHIFGRLVKDLQIKFDDLTTLKLTKVFNFIRKRCVSLKALKFVYDDDESMFEPVMERSEWMITNPLRISAVFPSLETLFAGNVYFKSEMKMNECFPNLKSLNLLDAAFEHSSIVEVHMPNLVSLYIGETEATDFESDYSDSDSSDCDESDGPDGWMDYSSNDDDDDEDYSIKNVNRKCAENVIRLNPQLESLKIDMEMDTSFIEFLRDSLPLLQNLSLDIGNCEFDNNSGAAIVFKNVAVFEFEFLDDITSEPPITSENLTHLILSTGDNTFAFDFIKKNQSVKTLDLECEYNAGQVLELVAALPDLKQIDLTIEENKWTPADVKRVLTECKRLDAAKVTVDLQKNQSWRSLENIWEINVDDITGAHVFEKKIE